MKVCKGIILWCLLLFALSLFGTVVMWVMSKLVSVSFANIFYSGFKIGFAASVILLCGWLIKIERQRNVLIIGWFCFQSANPLIFINGNKTEVAETVEMTAEDIIKDKNKSYAYIASQHFVTKGMAVAAGYTGLSLAGVTGIESLSNDNQANAGSSSKEQQKKRK